MMSHCMVRGCRNSSGRTDSAVTFHPFPAERGAAERWASLSGVSGQKYAQLLKDLEHGSQDSYHLCSLHFEQQAFETNPDDKSSSNINLRRGAEPTLLLSPARTPENSAEVITPVPAACSPHGGAPPAAPLRPSCAGPDARTSQAAVSDNGRCSSPHGPRVSHCSAGTTVVNPQPGVSQIVLNFCEGAKSVTLDNVSPESAPQCRGGCHCQQKGVKQVVIIFLDRPKDSVASSSSSQESPLAISSSTQTEGRDGEAGAPLHPETPLHVSTQTSPGTEGSPEPMEGAPQTSEVSRSPREQICPSKDLSPSVPDTQTLLTSPERSPKDGSGGQADMDYLPPALDETQEDPKSLDQEDGSNVDSQAQQIADDQAPKPLRKCELRPETPSQPPVCPHCQRTCRPFCSDPSINQYVGDLLQRCNVPPPPCISAASSSSCCSCISAPHRVKQIVVNFGEPESAAVSAAVPSRCSSSRESSPPAITSQQHQETQTCDWFLLLQKAQENPESPSPRPPKSRSCPPVLNTRTTPICQEGAGGPAYPQDVGVFLDNKVTFEDVAVYFSKEEWELLGDEDKDVYREVMSDNCRSLISLGLLQEKPDLVLRIENNEENLWVNLGSPRRVRQHEEDPPCFLDQDMDGVRLLDQDKDASPCSGRESAESSSHLGALMRLVNEIPGFLLGSSVTDGSSSPTRSTEDPGIIRTLLEVKTEDHSPSCSPASSHAPVSEIPEVTAGLGVHRSMEQSTVKIVTKAEKREVAVSQSSRYGVAPVTHLPVSPSCIKSDPGASAQGRPRIKQEAFPAACSPHPLTGPQRDIFPVKPILSHFPKLPLYSPGPRDCLIPDHIRRPCSGGGTSLSRSAAASPRNPSVSPNHGANCTALGELKIKIKQEDSGSDRDLSESPVYGRRVLHPPGSSSVDRELWQVAASPLRSPADAPLGSSPLHRLVNCLKEISAVRPRLYNSTWSPSRWGAETSSSSPRDPLIPAPPPNPFTVAVTNGVAQLRGTEPRTSGRDESHVGPVPLSALGRCLEKIHSRISSGGSHSSEESRRAGLGVKRTHSDDLSCRSSAVLGGVKRPTLEVSGSSRVVSSCSPSHRDLWRPPEELPRAPSVDQPVGNSPLMSVMNCVRKIPGRRLSPSVHALSPADSGRSSTQGIVTEVKVKQEKDENRPLETSRQWIQPPPSPDVPKQSGSSATNVHLTGLMRLMEEIPCAESSNPSRAMYSIAVGHSLVRRMDRSNHLSSSNDDCSFQEELNDGTIASVDSVYSDDTSWSSENVDPSYSAIGGLQRVVSEFAELGSVSPLVAVAAPLVSSVQEGIALKKPKDASTASTSRLSENIRRSPREAAGVAASACSRENGEAAIAAIRGLQKVVHGFVEQECVSPITAVRNVTPSSGPRDYSGKKSCPEEEAPSPLLQGSSPAPISHYLCDSGKWLSEPDSSYSALSGLQKVVNGFSELSCVSPFSAVSTPASDGAAEVSIQRKSDAPALDLVSSTHTSQKNVINGTPDSSYLSPLRVASISSESDAGGLSIRSRDETSQKCMTERQRPTTMTVPSLNDSEQSRSSSSPAAARHQCIDLTQEEESLCNKTRSAAPERKQKIREGRHSELPGNRPENPVGNRTRLPGSSWTSCNQLIDLTVEEETLTKPKISSAEAARKPSHAGTRLHPPLAEKRRLSAKLPKAPCGKLDKPLDPGASGSIRGAVPAVNEHLSGLEKLLSGVPTFPPVSRPSGQALGGSWWFKSTSPPET